METTDRLIADRYALQRSLGRGGMGVVWLAEDTLLQRRVAVKEVAFPQGTSEAELESMRARVMREARAAARLNHPNVTTVYDVLRDDGRTYIVMEYVDGPTLDEVVAASGPLSPADAAVVGLSVASALEAAHGQGIVHRDVKPSNVMVADSGRVKLADFGVAALAGDPKITMTGFIVGSPSYMSPEQAREGESRPESDYWGLGATLYFAVEGEPPFAKPHTMATLNAVAHEPPRPMTRAGSLAPAITALLEKEPGRRPTAARARELLSGLVEDDSEDVAFAPADDEPDDGWAARPAQRPGGAGGGWALVLGVLALLAIGAVFAVDGLRGNPPAEDAAAPGDQIDEATATEPAGDAEPAATPEAEAAAEPDEQPDGDTDTTARDDTDEDVAGAATVPADWEEFSFGPDGAAVAHPPGWRPRRVNSSTTDLVDPDGGRYLRVAWTDSPKDDPVADWQSQSESFGASHSNYEEISIEAVDYRDYDAALWEYRYSSGGADLHAYNLGFVTGGRGYALNFQTREDQWDESQDMFEQFKASFRPAS